MKNVIILGSGGFGREVYQWAIDSLDTDKYTIKGFVSNDETDLSIYGINKPILGNDDSYKIQENDLFLAAIGNVELKKKIVEEYKAKGANFLTLIHPTVKVAETAKLGEGVILCPYTLVSTNVKLGDFVMLNFYSSVGHDVKVGNYSVLSPYATVNGNTEIGEEVFMGTHSTAVEKIKIGDRSKISANSVAMDNVTPKTYVIGVPGKKMIIF